MKHLIIWHLVLICILPGMLGCSLHHKLCINNCNSALTSSEGISEIAYATSEHIDDQYLLIAAGKNEKKKKIKKSKEQKKISVTI
ncbi:hypothetical protein [Cardinium endosymbiont of Dermatophagoides farinae]|uniref:hypothetical protein n=1 Tax=Cardinium endosymbiont of Dermatophagoides farinae TaxID=2597823 RepID=UPI001CB98536|nr:hypothetical protein [Cardinium endosymbiont of Dermatophagoides farinae]